ncbi:MarR family winged helix-turn-helix transcriptional regulator [Motilibacter deserti]|uniref:MarR family transcriptional regulator n=1 Tax=Motilibacter deserti TaxID=2714956 RepID=A0ABX0H1H8_9ACTN|nr:MarR family transcriptional regulator [Motilibacter deserti]NHC15303.1 MarR family transcriptional regulator [Motilibacter deserti]
MSPEPAVAAPGVTSTLALIHHLSRLGQRSAESAGVPSRLRPRQFVALTLLREQGNVAQQTLAEALRLDPSNLVGLLNELESGGLVVRRRDPNDRRRHIVELADDGRRALEDAERELRCVEDGMLRTLAPDERATLHDLLRRAVGDQLPSCTEAVSPPDAC